MAAAAAIHPLFDWLLGKSRTDGRPDGLRQAGYYGAVLFFFFFLCAFFFFGVEYLSFFALLRYIGVQ